MKNLLLVIGVVAVFGLIGGAYYFGTRQTTAPTVPVVSVTTPATTGVVVPPVPISTDPNVKTFTSADLKISFQYLEMQNDEKFAAKQTGNKVYVYQEKFSVDQGQYVEVFSKDKTDDLKTAVEKKFLADYSKADCFVEIGKNPVAKQAVPATFVFAQISFAPPPGTDSMEAFSAAAEKCPKPYTAFGGIAYFLMDSLHPETFAFFSIGQYAINAGPSLPWQSTIKFL